MESSHLASKNHTITQKETRCAKKKLPKVIGTKFGYKLGYTLRL